MQLLSRRSESDVWQSGLPGAGPIRPSLPWCFGAAAASLDLPIRSNCSKNTRRLNLVKNSFLHFLHSTQFSRQRLNFPTKFTFRLNLLGRLNVMWTLQTAMWTLQTAMWTLQTAMWTLQTAMWTFVRKNEHCKLQCGHCKLQCVHCTFSS